VAVAFAIAIALLVAYLSITGSDIQAEPTHALGSPAHASESPGHASESAAHASENSVDLVDQPGDDAGAGWAHPEPSGSRDSRPSSAT
jgi:hypothetical protein